MIYSSNYHSPAAKARHRSKGFTQFAPPSCLRILLVCAMLFITLGTRADDYKEVGQLRYQCNSDNKTATLFNVSSTSKPAEGTALTIPETIVVDGTTYTVTALNANCLSTENGCPLLGSITLPSTVKTIGENAFKGQSKLTSVNFPDVETIVGGAFSGCTSLKEATLGIYTTVKGQDNKFIFDNDVPLEKLTLSRAETDKSTNDKDDVKGIIFQTLTNLKEIHLPALKTLIWRGDFNNYKALTTIDAPLLENIPSETFISCDELDSVYLPGVKEIDGGAAFYKCNKLRGIFCPACTSVGNSFVSETPNLKTLNFPAMKDVGEFWFSGISSVTTINLPNAENIGKEAFYGCTSLTDLLAPKVKTIGDYAFYHCSSLPSVNMPYVTSIGSSAYSQCTKLSSVILPELQSMSGESFAGDSLLTELHLPKLTTLLNTGLYIPNIRVLDLPELTNRGSSNLIANNAQGNTTLEEVNAPKLETLNAGDFAGCTNLKKVNVEAAKTISGSAFSGCTSLESLSLPNATSIEYSAFAGCTALKYLDLPSATSIAGGAFAGCTALEYLHLGPEIKDVSQGQIFITNDALTQDVHIKLDYKDGVITAPTYLDAQKKDVYIYHVDYSLLNSYMNADTWKNFIFERTLDDASETQFTNGHYYFSLKRALKPAEWSTLVLPFSLTADEVKAMFGDNVKLAKYIGSTKNTEDGYILNFEKTETITAGEPVLICGADEKSDNTYLAGKLLLGTDDGSYVESNVSMTDPTTDTSNQFNLKGTYIHNASFIQSGDYYLGSGNALHHAKSAKALGSARMVVRYEGKNPQAKLAALNFDGVTTGIDEVRMDNDTREALTGSSSAPAYNLNGQRVSNSYKGIIIINGKKILKH